MLHLTQVSLLVIVVNTPKISPPPRKLPKYPQGYKHPWSVITDVKHTHFQNVAVGAAAAAVPFQHTFWEMRCCRGKKGMWCCTWSPSYIQGSNYFHAPPSCLRWILRSQKWRISTFHPSYPLYVLFLLCHSRACVINLLSAHANRTL